MCILRYHVAHFKSDTSFATYFIYAKITETFFNMCQAFKTIYRGKKITCCVRFANHAPFATSTKGGTLRKKFFFDFWPLLVHPIRISHLPFVKSLFKSIISKSDQISKSDIRYALKRFKSAMN